MTDEEQELVRDFYRNKIELDIRDIRDAIETNSGKDRKYFRKIEKALLLIREYEFGIGKDD